MVQPHEPSVATAACTRFRSSGHHRDNLSGLPVPRIFCCPGRLKNVVETKHLKRKDMFAEQGRHDSILVPNNKIVTLCDVILYTTPPRNNSTQTQQLIISVTFQFAILRRVPP